MVITSLIISISSLKIQVKLISLLNNDIYIFLLYRKSKIEKIKDNKKKGLKISSIN